MLTSQGIKLLRRYQNKLVNNSLIHNTTRSFASTSKLDFKFLEKNDNPTSSSPIFIVSRDHGFLPRKDPLASLPKKYDIVERLLSDMVVNKSDGSKGLMWYGYFGETVLS